MLNVDKQWFDHYFFIVVVVVASTSAVCCAVDGFSATYRKCRIDKNYSKTVRETSLRSYHGICFFV